VTIKPQNYENTRKIQYAGIRKIMKLLFLCIFTFSTAGCINKKEQGEIISKELLVFAASSLSNAFEDIAAAFETQHPGSTVLLNFASSSQLAAQLNEGLKADIFASADMAQIEKVVASGRIPPGAVQIFAANRLAVIVPVTNPGGIKSWEDIGKPGIQLILAADGVPIRTYFEQIIQSMPPDFQVQVYANIVSEEDNVRQVAAKIALNEADAGVVYTSDVIPEIGPLVLQVPLPQEINVQALYPAAILSDASQPELARDFLKFLLSPAGQKILQHWGFLEPTE